MPKTLKIPTSNLGLVFSGGGSRGAYQIGVWRALRELDIAQNVSAVCGTSVGAINGAAFVQDDYQLAADLWNDLNYPGIFSSLSDHETGKLKRGEYYKLIKGMIRNRGLNVDPLKDLLKMTLDEDKIRQSELGFGLVVYDLTHKKSRYLTKSKIPSGELTDYIIASATFPIFQPHKINDVKYLDGGMTDNRPLSLIAESSAVKHIICIDVTIGRYLWPNKGRRIETEVTYLRPSKLLGSPLAFRRDKIRKNVKLGYEDTMKKLEKFIF